MGFVNGHAETEKCVSVDKVRGVDLTYKGGHDEI